jgi:Fe-S oxidoreductase
MSMAYFVANESVAIAESFAAPAWACTGCFGCREHCDHSNDVTGTLFAARSALTSAGVSPAPVKDFLARAADSTRAAESALEQLSSLDEVSADASTVVLVGCSYARKAPDVARDAVRSIAKLTGGPVGVASSCCGAPLLYAGDQKRFVEQGQRLAASLAGKTRLVVVDAGCASTIRIHLRDAGVSVEPEVTHFVELAARELGRLDSAPSLAGGQVRWHDPCQLGRGLGVYDAPRAVLSRVLGAPPGEFERRREDARCSGGGGLLPVTMPDVARGIARQRTEDHARSGGGTIVTACASSRRSFEREGARAIDIVSVVAEALGLRS